MICKALHIEQPYSGEYIEKIYDIESPWNTADWTWIRMEEEKDVWCGEFRGRYVGVVVSELWKLVVVLTSMYIYLLDIETGEMIEYRDNMMYSDIACGPYGDIFLTDGYGLEMVTERHINQKNLKAIVMPIHADEVRFRGWQDNILIITCCEFLVRDSEKTLYLDCDLLEWVSE